MTHTQTIVREVSDLATAADFGATESLEFLPLSMEELAVVGGGECTPIIA